MRAKLNKVVVWPDKVDVEKCGKKEAKVKAK
jgi:hypothetical protein